MSMGMSYKDFYEGDVFMAPAYKKAFELNQQKRNHELWLQGRYFYDVMCAVFPLYRFTTKKQAIKPNPYVEEPYPVTKIDLERREERRKLREAEKMKAQFMAYASRLVIPTEERRQHKKEAEVNDVNND